MVITPLVHSTMVMAMMAADDWAMMVRMVPMSKNSRMVR